MWKQVFASRLGGTESERCSPSSAVDLIAQNKQKQNQGYESSFFVSRVSFVFREFKIECA